MKKIISLALIALFTLSVFAQEQDKKRNRSEFTIDQIAELQTKKMTFSLELTESQQQQILEINKRNAVERKQKMEARKVMKENKKEFSTSELFERKSNQLNKRIAYQAEMKTILNEKQFETWKKTRKYKAHKMKRKITKRKMHQRKMRR